MTSSNERTGDTVRVYATEAAKHGGEAGTSAANTTADSPAGLLQTMFGVRRMERDMAQIAADPASLRGYSRLPESVQRLASSDPMRFWMLWQMSEEGVDLHEVERTQQAMQRCVEESLRAAGWDGTTAPTDEQLARAELTALQQLQDPEPQR
jgi:hypothetical protein